MWIAYTGGVGNVGERAIAVVVKQGIARTLQAARAALYVEPTILAIGRASKLWKVVQAEVDVVCHHQIDKSVSIIISERSTGRPSTVFDTGPCRDVGKGPIPIVLIEDISA